MTYVEAVALIAHLTNDRTPIDSTKYTTPKDHFHAIDPERTPDFIEWIAATQIEYDILEMTMGCWEIVDIISLPDD